MSTPSPISDHSVKLATDEAFAYLEEHCRFSPQRNGLHDWQFDDPDRYIICTYCEQRRLAATAQVVGYGR